MLDENKKSNNAINPKMILRFNINTLLNGLHECGSTNDLNKINKA